jgi:hypothetical protein
MPWIRTRPPTDPEVAEAMRDSLTSYPSEYAPARRAERHVPDAVARDNIVLSHSLIPAALRHVFAAYGAMLDPTLPLTRAQHEMIATVVSSTNECFY